MSLLKLIWTALTWALGLGPLGLMAHGVRNPFPATRQHVAEP